MRDRRDSNGLAPLRQVIGSLRAQVAPFLAVALLFVPAPTAETSSFADLNSVYGEVLRHVGDDGWVDYASLKTSPHLKRWSEGLARFEPDELESADEADAIAFWINAYNGLTLQIVAERYPISPTLLGSLLYPRNSIRQISGVWDEILSPVAGRRLTLDQIEHSILRVEFDEPRIHLALVCAARGCPPLRNEPYCGEDLDRQLDDQVTRFVADPAKFRISRTENVVYLSRIFEWYGEDFPLSYATQEFGDHDETTRAVLNFLSGYLPGADRNYLREGRFRVRYLDYDWSLNEAQ